MQKILIVSHRSEAAELLEALQLSGTCQILNADEAIVSKDSPELSAAGKRPKDIEDLLNRLTRSISFLKQYAESEKGIASILAPRKVINQPDYNEVVANSQIFKIIDKCGLTETKIEQLKSQIEDLVAKLGHLQPWISLATPVEELGRLQRTTCLTGLIPAQQLGQVTQQIAELGGAIQQMGSDDNKYACLVICLNETLGPTRKLLRSLEFEPIDFESATGTVADIIEQDKKKLNQARSELDSQNALAESLSENLLKLQILHDHYVNLLDRDQTKAAAPATECTVPLEGWVRKKDYGRLEKTVSRFGASALSRIEPAKDEDIPVEIENKSYVRPFEVITRLYGMPRHIEVDPTIFLAPFFALFFGLCLTDAGYGLIMVALAVYFIRKTQGDKKFGYMFLICSVLTVICGAILGGWFGDAIQLLNIPWLNAIRAFFLRFGFDPSANPMVFFAVALIIGYIQLMFGITVAFFSKLSRKDVASAVCDHLTWLIMLNCLAAYGFTTTGKFLTPEHGHIFLKIAAVPAATIFLFSHREGGIVARLGMGFYNLASTMFYIGDILSYVRLMALGMVTAGFAAAINQMAMMAWDIKFVGPVVAIAVLIALHSFNLAISALGSFVHSLRLQYVEFFPKFFEGGGKLFVPFSRQYKYIYINNKIEE